MFCEEDFSVVNCTRLTVIYACIAGMQDNEGGAAIGALVWTHPYKAEHTGGEFPVLRTPRSLGKKINGIWVGEENFSDTGFYVQPIKVVMIEIPARRIDETEAATAAWVCTEGDLDGLLAEYWEKALPGHAWRAKEDDRQSLFWEWVSSAAGVREVD